MTDDITLTERIAQARAQLAAGNAQDAFQTLRKGLEYPRAQLNEQQDFVAGMRAFAEIARAIAGAELGDAMDALVAAPDHPQALYDAGYALLEQSLHRLAATVLVRANTVAPAQPPILAELCAALEGALAYRDAGQILEASGCVGKDELSTYLSGFYALMTGQVARARSLVQGLRSNSDARLADMVGQLHGMTSRAELLATANIELGERALSAWHAALNGSLLLSESPYGYDEPMRGRYAFVQDSASLMRLGIERLRQVLAHTAAPTRVIAAPDRASQILAQAVARAFSLPLVAFAPGVAPGLVVAWNLDSVGNEAFFKAYREHRAGDILFAHISQWVDPFPYAPDVTTLLAQTVTHPFMGGALVAGADGKTSYAPPDARSDAELAAEILEKGEPAESQTPVELPLAILRALEKLPEAQRLGLMRVSGARTRQRAGSPVASARFE